jgi:hypothetical protein
MEEIQENKEIHDNDNYVANAVLSEKAILALESNNIEEYVNSIIKIAENTNKTNIDRANLENDESNDNQAGITGESLEQFESHYIEESIDKIVEKALSSSYSLDNSLYKKVNSNIYSDEPNIKRGSSGQIHDFDEISENKNDQSSNVTNSDELDCEFQPEPYILHIHNCQNKEGPELKNKHSIICDIKTFIKNAYDKIVNLFKSSKN